MAEKTSHIYVCMCIFYFAIKQVPVLTDMLLILPYLEQIDSLIIGNLHMENIVGKKWSKMCSYFRNGRMAL